jgi:hypothetical protein
LTTTNSLALPDTDRLLSQNATWAMALLLFAAALWPLAVFPDPELQDYPNHLARAFILLHQNDPLLQANYRIDWQPVPDLGWDLWAIVLGRYLPLEWTAKLIVVCGCALTITGCFAISRILVGKWTPLPLIAFPLLFNAGYEKGFLGFGLGIGLSLWAMAWWLWVPSRRWALRLAVATVFATVLYVVHFYAFAVYGVFVLGVELEDIIRSRREHRLARRLGMLLRDGAQALPAIALMWCSGPLSTQAADPNGPIGLMDLPWERIPEAALLIDVETVAGVVLLCVAAAVLLVPFALGWMRLRPRAIIAIGLYVGLFFLLPNRILDTSYVAWRILLPALLIAIAASVPAGRWQRQVVFAQIAIAALITATVPILQLSSWRQSNFEKSEFLAAIASLPEGSRLFWAHTGMSRFDVVANEAGAYHVGSYAVIAKRALVQSEFVSPWQHPVRYRDAALQAAPKNSTVFLPDLVKASTLRGFDLRRHILRFDYVLMHGPESGEERAVLPVDRLRLVNKVGDFRLYAVLGGSSPTGLLKAGSPSGGNE